MDKDMPYLVLSVDVENVRDQFSKIGNHYGDIWNTKKLLKSRKKSPKLIY